MTVWPEMAGNGRFRSEVEHHKRTGSDELLVVALSQGKTFAEAGEIAAMSERTARRRATDPEIAAAVERLRAETLERATARLLDTLDDAAGTLRVLLDSESEAMRLKTVCAIFDQARSMRELHSVERRLDAIERVTQEQADHPDAARWSA